jgi:hypothetical protein
MNTATKTRRSAPSPHSTERTDKTSNKRCAKTLEIQRHLGIVIFNSKRCPPTIRVCGWFSYQRMVVTHSGPQVCRTTPKSSKLTTVGYDVYDKFSKPYQKFFDGLTATFVGDGFLRAVESGRVSLYEKPRGSPANVGKHLSATHPLVRTNPVTGWKSLFAIGNFPKVINELDPEESEELLQKFYQVILDNHDIQVRFKWKNANDIGE